jgi:hypothetical protein
LNDDLSFIFKVLLVNSSFDKTKTPFQYSKIGFSFDIFLEILSGASTTHCETSK